jgi:hypothetical protein
MGRANSEAEEHTGGEADYGAVSRLVNDAAAPAWAAETSLSRHVCNRVGIGGDACRDAQGRTVMLISAAGPGHATPDGDAFGRLVDKDEIAAFDAGQEQTAEEGVEGEGCWRTFGDATEALGPSRIMVDHSIPT